ncbi:MAG: cytosol aminopeptidase [Pseudomonadota bacterium]|jgi:leucyl aminopeptidase
MTTLPPVKPVSVTTAATVANQSADVVFVVIDETDLEAGKIKKSELQDIDAQLGGAISALVGLKDFEGKWLSTAVTLCSTTTAGKRVVLVGGGKKTDEKPARARQIGLKLAEEAARFKAAKASVTGTSAFLGAGESVAQMALGLRMGSYKYPNSNLTAETRKELETPVEFKFAGLSANADAQLKQSAVVADAIETCRLLQDAPPNVATPVYVANVMAEKARAAGLGVQIYGGEKLRQMGFGAMMAVAGGSANDPQFVVFEYAPTNAKKSVAFVGKGLTMDTGGYSLKTPSTHQVGMKYDMSGAAVVLNAVVAIAKLQLPIRVFGVAALCENMVDAHAYRVGDVLTTYSGKTIEVLNTDAEGRIVLSDALAYTAKDLKPDTIVEYSTLTGAMISALGHLGAGIFSFNSDTLEKTVLNASQQVGERVWPMPTWDEIGEDVKGTIADVNNIGATAGAAGSSVGAMFLKEFVENKPYCHVDIAGVANGNMAVGFPKKISSGFGVQLSIEIARALSVG